MCSVGYTDGFYYVPRVDKELVLKFREGLIVLSGNKYGEIPNKILNEIDERGLAIWFMDDGSVYKNTVNIHSNSFSYDTHLKFVELFKKFGIECNILKSRKYYYLKFDIINSEKFINIIYKYIHSDLLYKVKTKNIEFFNQKLEKYKWNNDFLNYGTLIVTSKEYIKNKSKFVYDIEVADNHNFVLAKKTYKSQSEYCDGPIVSNCHHTPGRIFSKIFYKIGTKYNLGLSATLTRSDGLTKVIKYFLGDTIVSLKLSILSPTIIVKFTNIDPLEEKRMVNGKANLPGMINDICDSFARNLEIINIIKNKYSEERKILVLTDRRNHCNVLQRLLNSCDNNEYTYSENTGLYYGGIKNEKLIEANKNSPESAAIFKIIRAVEFPRLLLFTFGTKFNMTSKNSILTIPIDVRKISGKKVSSLPIDLENK